MIFYHGTTEGTWKKIQKDKQLWGDGSHRKNRVTYLTPNLGEASGYGGVILEVAYNPKDKNWKNNWIEGCWQHREYKPIPLNIIKKIDSVIAKQVNKLVTHSIKQGYMLQKILDMLENSTYGELRPKVENWFNKNGDAFIQVSRGPKGRAGCLNYLDVYKLVTRANEKEEKTSTTIKPEKVKSMDHSKINSNKQDIS